MESLHPTCMPAPVSTGWFLCGPGFSFSLGCSLHRGRTHSWDSGPWRSSDWTFMLLPQILVPNGVCLGWPCDCYPAASDSPQGGFQHRFG